MIVNSLKNGRVKRSPNAGDLNQLIQSKLRFGKVLHGHLAQAFFPKQCQMHRCSQGAERLIGADVRGGLLAADVLLACGERQHESPAAASVVCLSCKASRHLPHEFLVRRDHPDKRPSVARRKTEALAFQGDDVGLGRRPTRPSETPSVTATTRALLGNARGLRAPAHAQSRRKSSATEQPGRQRPR